MKFLESLSESIQDEIAQGRIGRPVSVRAYLETSPDHGRLRAELARMGVAAMQWLDDVPRRVYVLGAERTDHLAALFEGADGGTALVTTGVQRRPSPMVDLLVLGERGTIRFDASTENLGSVEKLSETASDTRVLRAIEDSLRSRSPVDLPHEEEN